MCFSFLIHLASFIDQFHWLMMVSLQLPGHLELESPYHTWKLGYGLGLNSMQGREAKQIKLALFVQNTCNVRKSLRWWTVFRHEFVSMVWLREKDAHSLTYRSENKNVCNSYLLIKRVKDSNNRFCCCGQLKPSADKEGCDICTSDVMKAIRKKCCEWKNLLWPTSNVKKVVGTYTVPGHDINTVWKK